MKYYLSLKDKCRDLQGQKYIQLMTGEDRSPARRGDTLTGMGWPVTLKTSKTGMLRSGCCD